MRARAHTSNHIHPLSHTHTQPDTHLLLIKFQKRNTFGSGSKYLFEVLVGVCVDLRVDVQVVLLSLCVLRSSASICASLKVSTHIIHLSMIGTGNYVGQGDK